MVNDKLRTAQSLKDKEVRVRLYRDTLSRPWGFRFTGGIDSGQPLTVQRVYSSSPADTYVLKDDIIQSIDNYDVVNMTYKQVQDIVRISGKELILLLHRNKVFSNNANEDHFCNTQNQQEMRTVQQFSCQNYNYNEALDNNCGDERSKVKRRNLNTHRCPLKTYSSPQYISPQRFETNANQLCNSYQSAVLKYVHKYADDKTKRHHSSSSASTAATDEFQFIKLPTDNDLMATSLHEDFKIFHPRYNYRSMHDANGGANDGFSNVENCFRESTNNTKETCYYTFCAPSSNRLQESMYNTDSVKHRSISRGSDTHFALSNSRSTTPHLISQISSPPLRPLQQNQTFSHINQITLPVINSQILLPRNCNVVPGNLRRTVSLPQCVSQDALGDIPFKTQRSTIYKLDINRH